MRPAERRQERSTTQEALEPLLPVFASYVLSFIYGGIYWNNHHHMFHAVAHVNGNVLWANLHLLFWLSLIPFSTSGPGENHVDALPAAMYGFNPLMRSIAYAILARLLIRLEGPDSTLARALGPDRKGTISTAIYVLSIPLAFVNSRLSVGCFVIVALIWLRPGPSGGANPDAGRDGGTCRRNAELRRRDARLTASATRRGD